jgi:hypothetical protein
MLTLIVVLLFLILLAIVFKGVHFTIPYWMAKGFLYFVIASTVFAIAAVVLAHAVPV